MLCAGTVYVAFGLNLSKKDAEEDFIEEKLVGLGFFVGRLLVLDSAAEVALQADSLRGLRDAMDGAQSAVPANAHALSASATGSCVVRCGRRCSYPGHCRRDVDTDGNWRCDPGECLS
jgi:hypothetical protein